MNFTLQVCDAENALANFSQNRDESAFQKAPVGRLAWEVQVISNEFAQEGSKS